MLTIPRLRLTGLILAVCLVGPTAAYAMIPHQITFQARLADSAGAPVDGTYDLTLRVYSTPSAGAALWTESHAGVLFTDGLATLELGSIVPFPSNVFADTARYLGIAVEGEPELVPRVKFVATPFAFVAEHAQSAETSQVAIQVQSVPWNTITGVPAGLNDGDDVGSYSAGAGLQLVGSQFLIPASAIGSSMVLDNSLTAADLASEPGVAANALDAGPDVGTGYTILVSHTITVPAAGHVVAIGTTSISWNHVNGTTSHVGIGVSSITSDIFPADEKSWTLSLNTPSGFYVSSLTSTSIFAVAAPGTYTYYSLGKRTAVSPANTHASANTLLLMYFPTAYGTDY